MSLPQCGKAATKQEASANKRELTRMEKLAVISVDWRFKNICRKSKDFTSSKMKEMQ